MFNILIHNVEDNTDKFIKFVTTCSHKMCHDNQTNSLDKFKEINIDFTNEFDAEQYTHDVCI